MIVKRVEKDNWNTLSEDAHGVVFGEKMPRDLPRYDYALVCENAERRLVSYATVRELDAESVYWQYGGVFPAFRKTPKSFEAFSMQVDWCLERYKRLSFLVENDNKAMLRMAAKKDFMITGVRTFKNLVLLEHAIGEI